MSYFFYWFLGAFLYFKFILYFILFFISFDFIIIFASTFSVNLNFQRSNFIVLGRLGGRFTSSESQIFNKVKLWVSEFFCILPIYWFPFLNSMVFVHCYLTSSILEEKIEIIVSIVRFKMHILLQQCISNDVHSLNALLTSIHALVIHPTTKYLHIIITKWCGVAWFEFYLDRYNKLVGCCLFYFAIKCHIVPLKGFTVKLLPIPTQVSLILHLDLNCAQLLHRSYVNHFTSKAWKCIKMHFLAAEIQSLKLSCRISGSKSRCEFYWHGSNCASTW